MADSNTQSHQAPPAVSPLPAKQFKRFILFFHAVFLGGLGVSLVIHWSRPSVGFGRLEATLLGLVALQAVLYVRFFLVPTFTNRWPSNPWWAAYFATSTIAWLLETHLEPAFSWALGAYLGQILGLSWRISVPISLVLCGTFFVDRFGWKTITSLTVFESFVALGCVAAWIALGLFLHRALATSSERAKLILELESAKRQLELSRQRDAELAALQERERLARDLHDTLGHALVTLSVQLEAAKRTHSIDPALTACLFDEMLNLTRSNMASLRRSLDNLRDAGLQNRPLTTALKSLCAETANRAKMIIECEVATDSLPSRVEESIWRVAQEGLMNIEKHSGAAHARLSLHLQARELTLRLADDGAGLPAGAENKPGHYGLRGMREHIEGIGGTLTLLSSSGGGTVVQAQVVVMS